MRRSLLLLLLTLSAQLSAQKPSLAAIEEQDQPQYLLLSLSDLDLSTVVKTSLFLIEGDYAVDGSGQLIQASSNVTPDFLTGALADAGMGRATLTLRKPLENKTYVLVLQLRSGEFASAKIEPKGTISTPIKALANRQIKITSPVFLGLKAGDAVVLERSRATTQTDGTAAKPVPYPGVVAYVAPDEVDVELKKKLPAGQTSSLSLKSSRVPAEGKVALDAAPANESDAYVLVKVNAVAAVHQAPVFTLSGSVAPLHPEARALYWGPVRFDPVVVFDTGLRSTRTANSITVPASLYSTFLFGLPKGASGRDFRSTATADPVGMTLSYGPRYETDRTFRRVNLLGDSRLDLFLPQLSHSVQAVQARASARNPKIRDFLEAPLGGFQVTPYLEFVAGAHVNNETVTNTTTKTTELVPEHSIARIYGGLSTRAQFWRFQLNADTSVFNLFDRETIGYTTPAGVALRVLSGVHFHAKPDFTFYLDPSHHVGLDLCYENGRIAPNFEYLNTVNAGIKVIY